MLQALVWDTGMFIKNNGYWDWEEMREIGESDTDVVRKLYGKLRTREGREQQSDILAAYLENYDLPGEVQVQIEQLEMRLLNYPSPDREEDRSIKNSFQLQNCVRWIQELSAAYYTLPAKAYRNLSEAGVWRDYVVPRIFQYESMSCYEVVSDIMRHVKGLGETYENMMKVMGKEHIKPDEIPGSYDWQYLRETEAAFIETLAMQKGLYLGEARFMKAGLPWHWSRAGNAMRWHVQKCLQSIWNIQSRNCLRNMNADAAFSLPCPKKMEQ